MSGGNSRIASCRRIPAMDPCDTDVAALRNCLVRVIQTFKKGVLPLQRYPVTVIASDGRQHYEERYWNAVSSPIVDEHGKLQRAQGCAPRTNSKNDHITALEIKWCAKRTLARFIATVQKLSFFVYAHMVLLWLQSHVSIHESAMSKQQAGCQRLRRKLLRTLPYGLLE